MFHTWEKRGVKYFVESFQGLQIITQLSFELEIIFKEKIFGQFKRALRFECQVPIFHRVWKKSNSYKRYEWYLL